MHTVALHPEWGGVMLAGETEQSPSPWTIDSLHQHLTDALLALKEWASGQFHSSEKRIDAAIVVLDSKLVEMDRRYKERFDGQEKAIAKSDEASEKRFESVNEFRSQQADIIARFMPRLEAETSFKALHEKVALLEDRHNRDVELINVRHAQVIGGINSRLDLNAGTSVGAEKFRTSLFAMIAAAAAIVGLAFALFGRN